MKWNEPQDRRRLRENFQLVEPDELTPEERWERVVEPLALMCLAPEPEAKAMEKSAASRESVTRPS